MLVKAAVQCQVVFDAPVRQYCLFPIGSSPLGLALWPTTVVSLANLIDCIRGVDGSAVKGAQGIEEWALSVMVEEVWVFIQGQVEVGSPGYTACPLG